MARPPAAPAMAGSAVPLTATARLLFIKCSATGTQPCRGWNSSIVRQRDLGTGIEQRLTRVEQFGFLEAVGRDDQDPRL